MTTTITRRGILKALGIGAGIVALEPILEPARKLWFVGSNAPVGSRIERMSSMTPAFDLEAVQRDLYRKIRSQADLDAVRRAARIVDNDLSPQQRDEILAGLFGPKRKPSGPIHSWAIDEEYEADHDNNQVGTVVLAG